MALRKSASQSFLGFIKKDIIDSQYSKYEAETDAQKIKSNLLFVEQLFPSHALMLCNRSHPGLTYVSGNCVKLFGFSDKSFQALSVNDFFNLVHPDDIAGLQQCFEFINEAEPYNPMVHRFVLYYRFKQESGHYIHLRDEKLALRTGDKFVYFTMFKDITTEEKFFHVKLDIQQYTDDGRLLQVYSYNPKQPDKLITPRQNDIIKLIVQGFSTQEIANHLNVSVNTVKNHKQVLFRKVNVKSSVELIKATKDLQVLNSH